jgi:hypothetical protein
MYKKVVVFFVFLNIISFSIAAQNFQMSSIQKLDGNSIISEFLNFKSTLICLDVQNGINLLSGEYNTQEFIIVCENPIELEDLYIQVFPNPAIQNAIIKFSKQIPLNDRYLITVSNLNGTIISEQFAIGQQLLNGFQINLQNLPLGMYFISVQSNLFLKGTKILKSQ